MGKFVDLTGREFERLTVIEKAGKDKHGNILWLCECGCKQRSLIKVTSRNLTSGNTKSCGCYNREVASRIHRTHGKTGTRLHDIWTGMKNRCYNPLSEYFCRYGERGIIVCEEWRTDYQAFYEWAVSHGYKETLEIERIDNDGNYEPSNCKWATRKEQNNNKCSNHLISYNGKMQTMKQWAEEYNINYHTLANRINRSHWSIEKAITTPVNANKRRVA